MAYPLFMMQELSNVKILMYDLACKLDTSSKVGFMLGFSAGSTTVNYFQVRGIDHKIEFAVPIFHVYGHKMDCQVIFQFSIIAYFLLLCQCQIRFILLDLMLVILVRLGIVRNQRVMQQNMN
jgi:hypothetical protein